MTVYGIAYGKNCDERMTMKPSNKQKICGTAGGNSLKQE